MTEEERAARKRARRRENAVVALLALALGGAAFWYAWSGRLQALLESHGIYVLQERLDEEEGPAELVPRDSLEDYSWEELSAISRQVAQAGPERGWEVARAYNLVDEGGRLTGGTKLVELADGSSFSVAIAGFNHDLLSDGSGYAGITFVSADCVALRPWRGDGLNAGGWEASELRAWLDTELAAQLPDELAAQLRTVLKPSNNTGRVETYDSVRGELVTNTADALWVPSVVELVGPVTWWADEFGEGYAKHDALINAEGGQYQRFAEAGVNAEGAGGGTLVRSWRGAPVNWWTRTPYFYLSDFVYQVMNSGYPNPWAAPSDEAGVVIGFCV